MPVNGLNVYRISSNYSGHFACSMDNFQNNYFLLSDKLEDIR